MYIKYFYENNLTISRRKKEEEVGFPLSTNIMMFKNSMPLMYFFLIHSFVAIESLIGEKLWSSTTRDPATTP